MESVEGGTYSATVRAGHHLGRQGPRGSGGGSLGAAMCPDVEVFVAGAGAAMPVAAGVVRHVGDFEEERVCDFGGWVWSLGRTKCM